ncbi:MAG: glycosyltransferase [Candidatus Colwellbacteria bacterium]|nr:glycosyltransferase [Candidatus Colwellbacteria bacterium]
MKVFHIITGLNTGGAEMMLYKLIQYSSGENFQHEVVSLTDIGPVGKKIQQLSVSVRALHMRGIDFPIAVLRLALWLRRSKPDIVQTWMYHADLVGGLAAKLAFSGAPIVWGIRQTNLHTKLSKRRTRLVARFSAFLSRWVPEKIICNSYSGRDVHIKMGYDSKKMVVIPNGFDISRFRLDSEARISVRKELGVAPDSLLIGYIARFDPQKDHKIFIEAARILNANFKDVHFVLCGRGVNWENKELVSCIKRAGLQDRFYLLGERDDIPTITAALDVASLTSAYGEGFPNVVGEAMASGVPCVVTDVGDAAEIVGNTGIVTGIGSAKDIADGWAEFLAVPKQERIQLGQRARERIEKHYALNRIVQEYMSLYNKLL